MGNFPTPKKRPWQISTAPPPQSGRKNPNQEFYNSRKWRLNRGRYIKKNPLCVICQGLNPSFSGCTSLTGTLIRY